MSLSRRGAIGTAALALSAAVLPCWAKALAAAPRLTDRDQRRIADLLARMTLDEKIGQMVLIPGGHHDSLNSLLDQSMLGEVAAGRIGAFLHVAGAEPTHKLQRHAIEKSRLGIPLLFGIDVVHGMRTIFPVPLAMAASFDPGVHEAAARIAASETAVSGLHWTYAPMADVARDPRWGRIVEGAGEDPWLGARMAEAQVRGFEQGRDPILACTKHFGAYGFVAGGRDYDSADISDRTLNEVCLPSYHAAVAAGSGTMMTAFNDIAGVPTTANEALVRGVLREKMGYDGMIVSDWNAIRELIAHGVAANEVEAAALALKASVDMDMASGVYAGSLEQAVAADPGLAPLVDQAVTRILGAKMRLGLFDHPYRFGDAKRERIELNSAAHRKIARDAAAKSLVLLKNDGGVLPLKTGAKVALIGALADDAATAIGSWHAQGSPAEAVTIKAALGKERGLSLRYSPGADSRRPDASGIAAAIETARASDIVLLVLGEDYDYTAESRSRSDIGLPGVQDALADAVIATGKPVVLLLIGGRPLAIEALAARVPAILECWLPGVEGGPAIADVLTGRVSPAGRLPTGMPRVTGQAPSWYAHYPTGRPADPDLAHDTARYHDVTIGPLFSFGHGLSYATFDYGPLTLDRDSIGPSDTINATLAITNRGAMTADEVVQLYLHDPIAAVAQPVKLLRGVKRLTLRAGESKRVSFRLSAAQCAYWHDGAWRIDAGRIELMAGASSEDIRQRVAFTITTAGSSDIPAAAIPTPTSVA